MEELRAKNLRPNAPPADDYTESELFPTGRKLLTDADNGFFHDNASGTGYGVCTGLPWDD